jgi:hypothetical protein
MTELPVPIDDPATLVDESAFAADWRDALLASGAHVIDIELETAADKAAFMERASDGLGLDEEVRARGWDGLQDRFWEALSVTEAHTVVVVLRNADQLVNSALGVLLDALDILGDLRRATEQSDTFPRARALRVVVTGTGASFPKPE